MSATIVKSAVDPAAGALTATPSAGELEELIRFLWAKNPQRSIAGNPIRLCAVELVALLELGGFAVTIKETLAAMNTVDTKRRTYDLATVQRLIPDYDGT